MTEDSKVHEWIQTLDNDRNEHLQQLLKKADVVLAGAPLSKSSISASFASETPNELRKLWKSFNPYNLDENVDLSSLKVIDLGDTKQAITDIDYSHEQIKQMMISMQTYHPHGIPIIMGGDHSITAQLIKGYKQVHDTKTIGVLQFDTHFDLRDPSVIGPANGTPIRQLIEGGIVKGSNVHTIGLHGYFNAKSLKNYADVHEVNYTTLKQAREIGVRQTVSKALDLLDQTVDMIYVTVDMDVLDSAFGPGAPASTPGGMRTDELFEAVMEAGRHPKANAMDLVCIDYSKDVEKQTLKAAVHVMLDFMTGLKQRRS
ncbi:agmatinase family protein [Geomicrobium sp. JCM 19038]|uniref:agmatinase family protein n=1 Tax=Geomicrobium sp. JCM 19038 TaxID=1460635 RepID=UPI0005A98745|nr:agmatinase family protein [Geomicrobium sp. JCM 19038]